MTYPPQQPGPYGQEPYGQPGQPGQYGQQPGQPGQQQPGQYGPPTGQFGQQPEQYGQTAQFGQPPGYDGGYGGYPGGPGGPPPPKKSSTGVITAVVIGAVLVLGGAGTGIYFLTKDDGEPSNTASSSTETTTRPRSTGSTDTSESEPTSESDTATPPTETSQGGGGGGGSGSADEAQIVEVAQKYAKAVTDQNEADAKALTCNNDAGLLYQSGGKVEVTGQPETYGEDSASIEVAVTIGSEAIPGFPLFMEKTNNGWCVAS